MSSFHKTFRLDVTANRGGLLVYVKGSLLAREIQSYKIPFDIQATPSEINLRKETWLLIGIYKPPSQTINTSLIFQLIYWMFNPCSMIIK